MPSISSRTLAMWQNYHLTDRGRYVPLREADQTVSGSIYPDGTIGDLASFRCADLDTSSGTQMFAAIGKLLKAHVRTQLKPDLSSVVPRRASVDCVAIGTGWSFSNLASARDCQIDMTGAAGVAMAAPDELHTNAHPRDKIALALGGTRLRELTNWSQTNRNLTIKTSGSHLGPTIAGAVATASHGSRLGYGGIQNMVIGLHLITGDDRSVWIERTTKPVLSDQAIARFADEAIRDDAVFEDVLVHLGAMGIVCGAALELVEDTGYALLADERSIDAAWLSAAAAGDFAQLAAKLGDSRAPVFYELTVDPWDWDSNPAIHTMYFESAKVGLIDNVPPAQLSFADNISRVNDQILAVLYPAARLLAPWSEFKAEIDISRLPPVFELYKYSYLNSDIVKAKPTNARWNQLHGDEITGGYSGALYNASYAIERGDLPLAIPAICDAVKGLLKTFLFTVRFVSNPAGTLAFTRFRDCAVIEIDGLSRNAPLYGGALGYNIEEGARLVREGLEAKRIEYSMHWGKLGELDAGKVKRDFGPETDPGSPISRWRATRERLLAGKPGQSDTRKLFWNQGVVDFGLVKSPLPDKLPANPPAGSVGTIQP